MNTLLEFSIILSIILSLLLLFFNKGYKSANRFLALFFFFIAVFVLSQYVAFYSKSLVLIALFASAPTPFVFLIGPMSFLYIRSILRDNASLSKFDYLHFLLFSLEFIGMIPYYFSSWESKLQVASTIMDADWHVIRLNLNWLFKSPINSILRPLHVAVYLILQWVMVYNYNKNKYLRSVPVFQKNLIRRWLYVYNSTFTAFLISYVAISVNLFLYTNRIEFQLKSQYFIIFGSLAFVLLNLVILLYPQFLYGLPRMIEKETINNFEETSLSTHVSNFPKKDPDLKPAVEKNILIIEEKLNVLINNSQPWVEKDFSLKTLSTLLDVQEHHLRYYFNHHLNTSFPQYKNQLRVKHVKKLLEEEEASLLSLEGIGKMAGFSSRSSFFLVFKNETGMTPNEYLLKYQDKS